MVSKCTSYSRLNANDRVDPYVALYEPPAPKHMQDVTHLRWRGLLPPSFIKEALDAIACVPISPHPLNSHPHNVLAPPSTHRPHPSS